MKTYTYDVRNPSDHVSTELTSLESSCKSCGKVATFEYELNGEHVGFYCSLCAGVLDKKAHEGHGEKLLASGVRPEYIETSNVLPNKEVKVEPVKPVVLPKPSSPLSDLANKKLVDEKRLEDEKKVADDKKEKV